MASTVAQRLLVVEQALQDRSEAASCLAKQLAHLRDETRTLAAELGGLKSEGAGKNIEARITAGELAAKACGAAVSVVSSPAWEQTHVPGWLPEPDIDGELDSVFLGSVPSKLEQRRDASRHPGTSQSRNESHRRTSAPRRLNSGVFVDAEELKEQIRDHLTQNKENFSRHYYSSGLAQRLVRSPAFETVTLVLICLNTVWVAVEIDMNPSPSLFGAHPIFFVAGNAFCVFFVLEFLVRVMAFKNKWLVCKDPWLVFDAVLVAFMVFETWVWSLLTAGGDSSSSGNIRALVVFRALRLLRTLRLARVLRRLPELMIIVRAIGIALRAISVILVLLGIIVYMGSVIFRVLLEDTSLGVQHFRTVPAAMATLLLEVTLSGTKGGPLIRQASSEHLAYGVMLLLFALLANITIMGVLGGLLVQTVKTVAEVEREENQIKHMTSTMDQLWERLVQGKLGRGDYIIEQQLQELLAMKNTETDLANIGVDLEGLINVSGFIFEQHEGRLTKQEFKKVVLDLRGKNAAKVKDHVETRRFIDMVFKRSIYNSKSRDLS